MDPQNKKAKKPTVQNQNVLETLKDVGGGVGKSLKEDLLAPLGKDFAAQLFGNLPPRKVSGEMAPGESLSMDSIVSGRAAEESKLRKQLALERALIREEKELAQRKSEELKLQLKAVMEEVQQLAASTQGLSDEIKIAAMQAPVEPGPYHLVFFEKLLAFIKSFRQKIDNASTWLHATNTRANQKSYWAKYKKLGSKFLLSSEHYLTRSAG